MNATPERNPDVEPVGHTKADKLIQPKRNRQHERSQASTARMLEAAAELFSDRGYRQTSLSDIGKQAGYSHGLVTRRFGSKQGLVVALLDNMIDDWTENARAPAVANKIGIAAFRAFFAALSENATANNNLRALESLMFEGLWGEPEFKARLTVVERQISEFFRGLIQDGIDAGEVRPDVDADAIAVMTSMAMRGATYSWLLNEDFDMSATLTYFGDVLETLLRPAT